MRKQWMILAVTAAVSLAAAGCQKYEKIELAGEGWESALDGQSSDRQDKRSTERRGADDDAGFPGQCQSDRQDKGNCSLDGGEIRNSLC